MSLKTYTFVNNEIEKKRENIPTEFLAPICLRSEALTLMNIQQIIRHKQNIACFLIYCFWILKQPKTLWNFTNNIHISL